MKSCGHKLLEQDKFWRIRGSHVGAGSEIGIKQIIENLNEVLEPSQTAQIALETMAGKGTEIGRTFGLAAILDGVVYNDELSVTLDTCHINDAGYNVKEDFDGVWKSSTA